MIWAMTLRLKMALQISATIAGLMIVGATALWGLDAVNADYGLATDGYQQLRQVYEVGSHLATARALLAGAHPDRLAARREVESAAARFELFATSARAEPASPKDAQPDDAGARGQDTKPDPASRSAARRALAEAARHLATTPEAAGGEDVLPLDASAINTAIGTISTLASDIRMTIEAHQASARHRHQVAARAVAWISAAVIIAAIALGITHYRGVMTPLGRLRRGVRKIAAGHFNERLSPRGGGEFSELAGEFNRMAAELDGFYHHLEEKVAKKSKELIRSERLASVGYLAAGVAHEINNPLGIISGYAEYSLEQLGARPPGTNGDGTTDADAAHGGHRATVTAGRATARLRDPAASTGRCGADELPAPAIDEIISSLRIICDEAFRCKDITAALLTLARQGDDARQSVCLADVTDKVVAIVRGLREYRDRKVIADTPSDPAARKLLCVSAVEAEMRQVLLNLVVNALEATSPGAGTVRIELARAAENATNSAGVELSVTDDGRGMSAQTLERVFEPFYTEKRGSSDARGHSARGTGLGLSITHAIVVDHGGSVSAHSQGPGKGSRFVLRLPAVLPDGI